MMPHMDGFEVLERLKNTPKTTSIPVIMLTAKGDEDSKVKSATLYNEGYIVKPVQIEFLKAKIEEVLERTHKI
jgi:two-component system phosphate regulon response regulator PhoB